MIISATGEVAERATVNIAATLRDLRDVGPRERIPELFEAHYVRAWFGLGQSELRSVLEAAPEPSIRSRPLARYTLALLRGEQMPPLEDMTQAGRKTMDPASRGMAAAMGVLEARLRGELSTAISLIERVRAEPPVRNALVDGSQGGSSFIAVQVGITCMLAGDFRGALAEFERVKWTDPPADLAFLLRDAHAKTALIHALVGDPDLARREIDDASRIPRTASWADPLVEMSLRLAEALIEEPDTSDALQRLLPVNRRELGEIWPYYVLALGPAALAGVKEVENLLTVLEDARLPGSDSGQGLPGSAIPLTRAAMAVSARRWALARTGLAASDAGMSLTALLSAGVALEAGNPMQALATVSGVASQTSGLRQLEIWRLSLVSLAHHALNETAAAEAARGQIEQLAEGLSRFNLAVGGRVGEYVRSVLRGESPEWGPKGPLLTPREVEVLACLGEGLSRREIAERLFVSMNTIKTQVAGLYRKFGVSSRDALLGEAYGRGLL
ncbi:response regulator transcription factor [Microbacterium tumbae]